MCILLLLLLLFHLSLICERALLSCVTKPNNWVACFSVFPSAEYMVEVTVSHFCWAVDYCRHIRNIAALCPLLSTFVDSRSERVNSLQVSFSHSSSGFTEVTTGNEQSALIQHSVTGVLSCVHVVCDAIYSAALSTPLAQCWVTDFVALQCNYSAVPRVVCRTMCVFIFVM